MAMAAMIKMMVTTINNSISENPLRLLWRRIMKSPLASCEVLPGTARKPESPHHKTLKPSIPFRLNPSIEGVFYTGVLANRVTRKYLFGGPSALVGLGVPLRSESREIGRIHA